MADQPAREEIAEGTVRGPEGMEEVTGAADYEGVTDSVVGAEVGTAEGVEAPTPEASTEPEKETGAKSNEHIDRVESQSGDKLSRGDSEGVGNEEISSTEGTAGHEGRDDEKGSPHDSKPNGTEGSEEKEKGKEGVVQSVASEDVKLVSPVSAVSPETRATATVIRRTRYGSDPRGTGGVGKVTYKSVKAAQKEEAARIDEEEEIDTTPAISSLPGYLPWERDLEMISAYQDKKVTITRDLSMIKFKLFAGRTAGFLSAILEGES